MYSGVPTSSPRERVEFLAGARLQCLGHAEVDHLDLYVAAVGGHQDVSRLQVAVDDAFLVRVLDRGRRPGGTSAGRCLIVYV
jgi:hypothetical protein